MSAPPSSSLSIWLTGFRPYLLIAALGFLLYFPSLFFDFVHLDDTEIIVKNYIVFRQPSSLIQAFREDPFFSRSRPYYRPLLIVSLIIDSLFMGDTPILPLYHFTTIVIHLIASCLVFKTLTKLNKPESPSLVLSLLFVIHPVLTPAVVIMPARLESLLAVFILAAFIQFLKFFTTQKARHLLMHFLFFFLALLTKESAFFLPFICLISLPLILKQRPQTRMIVILLCVWTALISSWFVLRHQALLGPAAGDFLTSFLSSLQLKTFLFLQLIGKIFFPVNLSTYPFLPTASILFGLIAICAFFAWLVFSRSKKDISHIIFGLSWFIIFLVPIFFAHFFYHSLDHRIYLSLVGILIVLIEIGPVKRLNLTIPSHLKTSFTLLLIFSLITLFHSFNFRDGIAFWQNAVQTGPLSPRSHAGLAYVYYRSGNIPNAQREADIAFRLAPQSSEIRLLRGLIFAARKLHKQAEAEYHEQARLNGYTSSTLSALALLYYDQAKLDQAEAYWQKALSKATDPQLNQAYQKFQNLSQNHTPITPEITLYLIQFYL